jgi:hypothetical protein
MKKRQVPEPEVVHRLKSFNLGKGLFENLAVGLESDSKHLSFSRFW